MNYENYSFSWKKGKFYLKSKTPLEGYEEITYQDKKSKEPKMLVTYHKYVDSIEGVVSRVEVKEFTFGKFLNVSLKVNDDTFATVQVPYKDKYGYSRETKAFVGALDTLKKGERVVVNPKISTFTKGNGKEGSSLTIWINYVNIKDENDKNVSTGFIKFEDIPKAIKGEKRGEVTYDNEPISDFFYAKLEKLFTEYGKSTTSETTSTETKPEAKKKTKDAPVEANMAFDLGDDDDDLPF